jgi:hypothetical protein
MEDNDDDEIKEEIIDEEEGDENAAPQENQEDSAAKFAVDHEGAGTSSDDADFASNDAIGFDTDDFEEEFEHDDDDDVVAHEASDEEELEQESVEEGRIIGDVVEELGVADSSRSTGDDDDTSMPPLNDEEVETTEPSPPIEIPRTIPDFSGPDLENPKIQTKEMTSKQKATTTTRKTKPRNDCFYTMCTMLCLIAGVLASFLALTLLGFDGFEKPSKTSDPPPGTTPLGPKQSECNFGGSAQPHVINQCACTGKIDIIADDVRARYVAHVQDFIPTVYAEYHDDISSCTARNQALIWLATDKNSEFNPQERRQRYVLAIIYISLNGDGWKDGSNWLSPSPSCGWVGVKCDNQQVLQSLAVDSNLAKGSVRCHEISHV